MNLLVVDCCVRGEASATRRLYRAWLEKQGDKVSPQFLYLTEEALQPLTDETMQQRTLLAKRGETEHEMFRYARQFRDAESILIAAPYWDLSFPSLLKVYLEHVAAAGVTFRYTEEGSEGFCRAKRIRYFSTAGGNVGGEHQGVQYVRALGQLLGIPHTQSICLDGLDIFPDKREALVEAGIQNLLAQDI